MWCKKLTAAAVAAALLVLSAPQRAHGQREAGEVLVPADTTFALELLSPLSTKTNKKDDKFDCKVLSPVKYTGAIVSGHLRKVKSSGKANGKSEIDLTFDTITFADGRVAGFNAQVKEVNDVVNAREGGVADAEGTVKGKSRVKVSVKRAVVGAAIGAGIGALLGGPKGAVIGAGIGASAGVASVMATEGPNLEFNAGTQFTVSTNAPSRRRSGPARSAMAAAASAAPSVNAVLPPFKYRTYSGGDLYSLSVPDYWREFSQGGVVALAPESARVNQGGRGGFTHAVLIGVASAGGRDLTGASTAFASGFMQVNKYLRQEGDFVRGTLSGRDSLAIKLTGLWPASARVEHVTIHTTMLRDGRLFFIITDVPQEDLPTYEPVFRVMLQSVQLRG